MKFNIKASCHIFVINHTATMFVTSLQQPMSRGLARLGDCLKRRAEPVAAGVAVVFARGFASSSGTKASSTSSPSPSPPPSGEGEGAAQATADFGFKTVRKEEKEKMGKPAPPIDH